MRASPYHRQILETLNRTPGQRIEGIWTLAKAVGGPQPSPNADLDVACEVSLSAELLELAGLIVIHRSDGPAIFELAPAGREMLPKPVIASLLPNLRISGALGISAALCSCASMFSNGNVPPTLPSIHDVRQKQTTKIEQVVDRYQGRTYFAPCVDCPTTTPKTLAGTASGAQITKFISPELLERARDALPPPAPLQANPATTEVPKIKQMAAPSVNQDSFVERRYVVFFKFGQHSVDPVSQLDLTRISKQVSGAQSVVVLGSTDDTGPATVNQQLALKRARAILKALHSAGVPETVTIEKALPNRIVNDLSEATIVGPAVPNTTPARARHVEILATVPAMHGSRAVFVAGD